MPTQDLTLEEFHQLMKDMKTGLSTLPASFTSMTLLGTTYTIADFGAKLDTYEAPFATADKTGLAHAAALKDRDAVEAGAREFVGAARDAFKAGLGKKSAALEALGLSPNKTPAPPTVQQKQERVAKAQATRKARGTMGPKQKAAIKGQVPPAQPPPAQGPKPGP